MKLSIFALVHVLALLLAYSALGIVLYQWFKVDLPLSASIKNSNYLSIGTFVVLPILGFVCIKYSNDAIQKTLGYLYVVLWVLALFRLLSIIFSK